MLWLSPVILLLIRIEHCSLSFFFICLFVCLFVCLSRHVYLNCIDTDFYTILCKFGAPLIYIQCSHTFSLSLNLAACVPPRVRLSMFALRVADVPHEHRQEALQAAVVLMPDENRHVLQSLLLFLSDMAEHADENQVSPPPPHTPGARRRESGQSATPSHPRSTATRIRSVCHPHTHPEHADENQVSLPPPHTPGARRRESGQSATPTHTRSTPTRIRSVCHPHTHQSMATRIRSVRHPHTHPEHADENQVSPPPPHTPGARRQESGQSVTPTHTRSTPYTLTVIHPHPDSPSSRPLILSHSTLTCTMAQILKPLYLSTVNLNINSFLQIMLCLLHVLYSYTKTYS